MKALIRRIRIAILRRRIAAHQHHLAGLEHAARWQIANARMALVRLHGQHAKLRLQDDAAAVVARANAAIKAELLQSGGCQ